MNIIEKQGNLLVPSTYLNEEDSNRELNIIHGCNAQGIMGAGLALQVRHKSEEVYDNLFKIPRWSKIIKPFGYVIHIMDLKIIK